MDLSRIRTPRGSRRAPRRAGRGESTGLGTTAGRGHKGQNSRSGGGVRIMFEGGQVPLYRRLPKFGFTNIFRRPTAVINLRDLDRFAEGSVVDRAALQGAGLVPQKYRGAIKILAGGEIKKPLTVKASAFSTAASKAIETAGGKAEIVKA